MEKYRTPRSRASSTRCGKRSTGLLKSKSSNSAGRGLSRAMCSIGRTEILRLLRQGSLFRNRRRRCAKREILSRITSPAASDNPGNRGGTAPIHLSTRRAASCLRQRFCDALPSGNSWVCQPNSHRAQNNRLRGNLLPPLGEELEFLDHYSVHPSRRAHRRTQPGTDLVPANRRSSSGFAADCRLRLHAQPKLAGRYRGTRSWGIAVTQPARPRRPAGKTSPSVFPALGATRRRRRDAG